MRTIIALFFLFVCFTHNAFAHKEWVHQYILYQAYLYLQNQLGKPIPAFWRQIGGVLDAEKLETFNNRPMERSPSATIGIYREDPFDAVFGYAGAFNAVVARFF